MFERTQDMMPYCWNLTSTDFIYMPDQASCKIMHIHISKAGEVKSVKEFTLPAGDVVKSRIPYNMDALAESHSCENKQALRDLICANGNIEELPETMRITSMRNKIFYLEKEDRISWFKPDEYDAEAVTLTSEDLYEVTGW